MHEMIVRAFAGVLRASAASIALIFNIFNAKIARFSTEKKRTFGAKCARHTQGTRAESANMRRTLCGTLLRRLRIFGRRWVGRKKRVNFNDFIETFAISGEHREFFSH